ncbi:hypothetical protein GCM10009785_01570 [Brooklawnia cerclae]|uniref:Uncharacterized protein n=1 Tax=Brooklawnia cerclae TaxID=349934 RepID=A0ABX0SEE5_9ACTN|nr:hypothetical protein [Brooklawnia cerclae]NIH56249.1 hypothetical protein [Brooklawnia cerclae]
MSDDGISFDIGEVTAKLRAFSATERDRAAKALQLGAEHILAVSDRHVPHEEGILQDSGTTSRDEQRLEAAISYDTPYAVVQHENLSFHHDKGKTAKFLENAMNSERDNVGKIVAQHMEFQ